MFILWAAGAAQAERRKANDARIFFFIPLVILTTLMIGLRFEVGGDWGSYMILYNSIYFLSLPASFSITDPVYAMFNWLSAAFDLGISFVNLCCAALFMGGLARLAWKQPNPALAILVAVPYLIIVVAMGYTRQAAAIGVICFAIADASERHLIKLVVLIGIAALLHKSAILILPIALVPIFRRNTLLGIIGALLFVVLFVLVLRDTSDILVKNYVTGNYDSQGATIRVAMNVVAAVLFLLLRKRIDLPPFLKSFWTSCAVLALVSVFALAASSASSGVDRISLYLIPLQVICYSRLPYLLSNTKKALPSVLIGVIAYSFFVQFVWLNYADNANYWIPYKISL
ncbi:EpsG family protein [Sphingomonas albertensis]|uniref:EpsG family protein n=1 Tax=Sphingomonas albertensis TaxID=2762591 RepID=A0ABR7ALH9_9SPHN|nr:EpsG family protein [Sphingomonas albertensis]MBC3941315.1 EpsG family protein [Sphingomonas albertensis]